MKYEKISFFLLGLISIINVKSSNNVSFLDDVLVLCNEKEVNALPLHCEKNYKQNDGLIFEELNINNKQLFKKNNKNNIKKNRNIYKSDYSQEKIVRDENRVSHRIFAKRRKAK